MSMKINHIPLLILLILITSFAKAGGETYPIGARQAGMGRASAALTDFWNIQNNQAGIALIDKISCGIFYENRFLINELSMKSAAVVVPTKIGVLGATFNYFGYSMCNDIKVGLVYARSFGPYFRVGVQLDYLKTTLGESYGSKSNITFELGIQSDVTENITIGAFVYNPVRVKLAEYDNEKLPAIFRFGISWKITKSLLTTLEAEKNTAINPIILRGGIEYSIKNKFFIRAGFSTMQEIFSMGFGMKIRFIRFDISAVMHQSLGFSPQSNLVFQF